jgi:hypothetical protein
VTGAAWVVADSLARSGASQVDARASRIEF